MKKNKKAAIIATATTTETKEKLEKIAEMNDRTLSYVINRILEKVTEADISIIQNEYSTNPATNTTNTTSLLYRSKQTCSKKWGWGRGHEVRKGAHSSAA